MDAGIPCSHSHPLVQSTGEVICSSRATTDVCSLGSGITLPGAGYTGGGGEMSGCAGALLCRAPIGRM
jgi:hypothetical protein